jgi:hypothetical protein
MTDKVKADKPASPATPPAPASAAAATQPAAPPNGEPGRGESIVTRLMRQGEAETDALLEAAGMRAKLSGEAQDLARLVERRLVQIPWGDHAQAVDQLDIQRAFLFHRFIEPMKLFERGSRGYAYLDNVLNLVSILAGVGASLTAAVDWPKLWPIVFGLIVGLLQSLSQWLKPSQRATRRGLAAAELRSEMWAFLQNRDRYKGKDDRTAWTLLCEQVERVEDRETTEQDTENAQTTPSSHQPVKS